MSKKPIQLGVEKVKSLLANKKFKEAFEEYEHLFKLYPFERSLSSLKKEIFIFLEKENKEKISQAIKEVILLNEKKEYTKSLQILKNFYKIAPNHKKLNNLIKKTQLLFNDELKRKKEIFEKSVSKEFIATENLSSEEFLRLIINFKKKYGTNKVANSYIEKVKSEYIYKRIEKYQELLQTNKFELIEQLLNSLKKISDSNVKIIEIENEIKKRKYDLQVLNLKESIYEAEKNIETLLKLKKFKKAYIASKELLRMDNKNKNAQDLYLKSKLKLQKLSNNETIQLIINDLPELKENFKNNPQKFLII